MSVLPGRHVFSQWLYVTSGACGFQYSIDHDMYRNWNVEAPLRHQCLVFFTARASDWSQRNGLYKFHSNLVKINNVNKNKNLKTARLWWARGFCQSEQGVSSCLSYRDQQRTPSALRKWPCWKYKGFSSTSPNCSAGTGSTHAVSSNTPKLSSHAWWGR